MSETTAAAHATDHHGPSEGTYWKIFVLLAAITALEVVWSYLGLHGVTLVAPLIVMMLIKFFIVAGYFMHLKFDMELPNGTWFRRSFYAGVFLAIGVYFIVFATFTWQI